MYLCSVSWQPTSWRYCSLNPSTVSTCVLCLMANSRALGRGRREEKEGEGGGGEEEKEEEGREERRGRRRKRRRMVREEDNPSTDHTH